MRQHKPVFWCEKTGLFQVHPVARDTRHGMLHGGRPLLLLHKSVLTYACSYLSGLFPVPWSALGLYAFEVVYLTALGALTYRFDANLVESLGIKWRKDAEVAHPFE